MIYQEALSVEEQVALNRGDEDWEDLKPISASGCFRRNTFEVERPSRVEPEPKIDKWKDVPYKRTLSLKH